MGARTEIAELSQALNLANEPQDWGIINADSARTDEFMRYCLNNELTLAQQYMMAELVMASVNDAMREDSLSLETHDKFIEFLSSNLHGLPNQIEYWKNLTDLSEFPIAELLVSLHLTGRA